GPAPRSGVTVGSHPSSTATQELVVPRSMPIVFAICSDAFIEKIYAFLWQILAAYAVRMSDPELRHELEATLAARAEVGQELAPQLVDRFADKVEQEIERRAQELAQRRRPSH